MSLRWKIPVLLTALLLLTFCRAPSDEPVAMDEDAIAAEVKAAREALDAAMVAEDIEGYLSHFMEDAVWLPPNNEEFIGQAVARQRLESFFGAVDVDGDFTIEEQVVMGPDWVGERGQFSVVLSPKQGEGESVHQVGSYLSLWTKDADGNWKIAYDMWNSDRGTPWAELVGGKK